MWRTGRARAACQRSIDSGKSEPQVRKLSISAGCLLSSLLKAPKSAESPVSLIPKKIFFAARLQRAGAGRRGAEQAEGEGGEERRERSSCRETHPREESRRAARCGSRAGSAGVALQDVIDPLERWREFGEKPDFAGLLTLRRHALHRGPGGARRRRRGDRRRPHRRPRLRPARRPLRPARDPRRQLPAGPPPRGRGRRLRGAAGGRLRRRAGPARRPRRQPRGDRAHRRPGPRRRARSRSCSAATTASPSPTSAPAPAATAGRSASSTSTPTPTPASEVFGVEVSHGTPMRRLVEQGHVDPRPLRPGRPARLLAGRGGVRLAGRAGDRRASSCTTCASSASTRSSSAPPRRWGRARPSSRSTSTSSTPPSRPAPARPSPAG